MLSICYPDNGTTPRVTVALVVVTIMDVNDNSPVITSITPESLEVQESAAPFALPFVITVVDRDTGENGEASYRHMQLVPSKTR